MNGRETGTNGVRLRLQELEERAVPSGTQFFAAGGGVGSAALIKVYDPNGNVIARFNAFESSFTGGVTVAVADVNGDGNDDVIAGASQGGAPRVTIFNGANILTQRGAFTGQGAGDQLANFFAFEPSQRGGCTVAAGNLTTAAGADVVVGAGPGGGPRVRVFDSAALIAGGTNISYESSTAARLNDFFAFDSNDRNGVNVAVAKVLNDASGLDSLVMGTGRGTAPVVRIARGSVLSARGANFDGTGSDFAASFQVLTPSIASGVEVAAADQDHDGLADLFVAPAGNAPPTVQVILGADLQAFVFPTVVPPNGTPSLTPGPKFQFVPSGLSPNYRDAVTVGGFRDLMLVGFGTPGTPGTVQAYRFFQNAPLVNEAFDGNFQGGVFVGT